MALAILHVEDNAQDVRLLTAQLKQAGYKPAVDVVSEPDEFLRALRSKRYDIVLADYDLPKWSGTEALRLLRQEDQEIPFILVTSAVGEDVAVECIKRGATDYVLKDRPMRLPLAVKRAIQERLARDQRREAEQTRDRLAAIVESSEDAIISLTCKGDIVSWNSGAKRIFGYVASEIQGAAISKLFASNRIHEIEETLERLGNGHSTKRYRTEGRTKSHAIIQVAVAISPLRDLDGTISGGAAIIRDITQHCFLEEQLRQSHKMEAIGRLAGGVAHDFNNILTVILGHAGQLQKKLHLNDPFLKAVLEIRRAAEQGAALTRQLLIFSRKQVSRPRALDLNVLVEGMQTMLERLIGEDLELEFVKRPTSSRVRADASQMSQVLMNLAANARDAMPMGGKIVIETGEVFRNQDDFTPLGDHPTGRYITLTVTDTGTGIDLNDRSRIFEPFFTTKAPGKGTGLGLATAYGIVREHGGWIDVDSEINQGTTVRVYLPALRQGAIEEAVPSGRTISSQHQGTILLVEDQSPVRMLVEDVLAESGYSVLSAADGAEALELAIGCSGSIDLLITDVVMPKMNGPELARHLSKSRPNLAVLYISGYSDVPLSRKRNIQPGTAFLGKPFTPEALIAEAHKLLNRSNAAGG